MTKEELKQEVKEYIKWHPTEGTKDFVVYKVRVGENAFAYVVEHKNALFLSDWIKMYEGTEQECYRVVGYLDSAEPREKQIAELEMTVGTLRNFSNEQATCIEALKAQIEKMKRCTNCKHSRTEYEHCKTNKHEKWEIKENAN